MAAVDYDMGRRNLGQLYTNLMEALKNKGDMENRRKAEDIEREGLFGSGIKSSDLRDLAQTGRGFIEFGEGRKERKMARATKSFDARMKQARERIDELRRFGDDDSINEIRFIQAGMSEERNRFENLVSDYEEMGVWESGLGSKGVGYKDTGEMSSLAEKYMKSKTDKDAKRYATLADESRRQQHQTSYFSDREEYERPPMDEVKRSDSQPGDYGDPIPTHGLRRKRRGDLSGIGKDEAPLGSGMMNTGGREGRGYPGPERLSASSVKNRRQREYEDIAGWDGADFSADLSDLGSAYDQNRRWGY